MKELPGLTWPHDHCLSGIEPIVAFQLACGPTMHKVVVKQLCEGRSARCQPREPLGLLPPESTHFFADIVGSGKNMLDVGLKLFIQASQKILIDEVSDDDSPIVIQPLQDQLEWIVPLECAQTLVAHDMAPA
jgi:hypothetical protein